MKNFFLIILVLFGITSQGQNYVPNPGFEIYDTCPNSTYLLPLAKKWMKIQETPDLWAMCASSTQVQVPGAFFGYQCPSNGSNFAGYCSFLPTNPIGAHQEIGGIKLTDSLQIGTKYYASFKLSLAGWKGNSDACSHNGLKLTTKALPVGLAGTTTSTNSIINNFAHFYSTAVITDTTNWTTISGSFTADSNYKYIYFGIFFEYSSVTMVYQFGAGGVPYYYIDDVCLSPDSNSCKIISQNNCVVTGINQIIADRSIYLAPNPVKESFHVSGINEPTRFQILNSLGQIIIDEYTKELQEISITQLPKGIYYFRLLSQKPNQSYQTKILKD